MRMKEKNFDHPSRKMSPCRNKGKREGEGERHRVKCAGIVRKNKQKRTIIIDSGVK